MMSKKGGPLSKRRILARVRLRSWFVACHLVLCLACGPSPANTSGQPTGSLVVTVRQGPDLVPFKPMVARTYRASDQITSILGHPIQLVIDGALMAQTEEDSAEIIARTVEQVARDLDALKKEDPRAIELARASFERLVLRYAPGEAAGREEHSRSLGQAKLDPATRTVDVVRGEARWFALGEGEVASVLGRAFARDLDQRYADVLPDRVARGERRAWFEYHRHGSAKSSKSPPLGTVAPLRVRGMIVLHRLAQRDGDDALVSDARKWLVDATSSFADVYHHHTAELEAASAGSPYRQAEAEWIGWINAELPRMSLDERATIAQHLWVIDFRKGSSERDRFASYSFPGLDPMRFALEAIDAWSAAGAPSTHEQRVHPYFEQVVCPAVATNERGHTRYGSPGRCAGDFYRWAVADRVREETFHQQLQPRLAKAHSDALAITVFTNAHRQLRSENDFLDFLRRYETTPNAWRVGADVHRETVFRPSERLLDEARRRWREVPTARADALFWFARHIDGSYHPESDWPDLLQGRLADEVILGGYIDLGWEALQLLPVAWPALARNGLRARVVTGRVAALFDQEIRPAPGHHGISATLAAIGTLLCAERAIGEVGELRSWAQKELARRPGAGLSDVVDATDPAKCAKSAQERAREVGHHPPVPKKRPGGKPGRNPDLFPPKADER